ncbi:MAG: Hpt domain-containing protein [Pseudomonadota bacterium]
MFNWRRQPAAPGPTVLDETYLERLEKHLGESILREILSDGLLELSDRLARVQELAVSGNSAELVRLVHDLSGMAGHLGLTQLGHLSVDAERALRQEATDLQSVAEPLQEAAPRALAALKHFLDASAHD